MSQCHGTHGGGACSKNRLYLWLSKILSWHTPSSSWPFAKSPRFDVSTAGSDCSRGKKDTMTVQNPRSRTISIRLSEQEYLGLKQLCAVTGARSVSDFTRDGMRVVLNGASRDDVLGLRMEEFRSLLKS